jgi:Ras-related GTP-binding protein A/B
VHSLIPNAPALRRHLTTFARACGATEVVLFERTTFLVVATSAIAPPPAGAAPDVDALAPRSGPASPARATPSSRLSAASDGTGGSVSASAGTVGAGASGGDGDLGEDDPAAAHGLDPVRYERTSELIKAFKHACVRVRADWRALVFEFPEFTAVLDELTKNMYVLVVVHDPTIGECT